MVKEQFLVNCNKKLVTFIRARECSTLKAATKAADQFMDAQQQKNLLHFKKDSVVASTENQSLRPIAESIIPKCAVCDRVSHTPVVSMQKHLVRNVDTGMRQCGAQKKDHGLIKRLVL